MPSLGTLLEVAALFAFTAVGCLSFVMTWAILRS